MTVGRVFFDGMVGDPRLDHPECVAVHPDGSVWCGGEDGQIFRVTADGTSLEVVTSTGGFILGISFAPCGDLYACDIAHRAVFRIDIAQRRTERFADGTASRKFVAPNYPAFASDGTLYVSDSNVRGEPGPGIYRFRPPDTAGELWYQPLNFANGLALAPDGSAIYVVESFHPGISRIPILDDGSAGEKEIAVELPRTVPDGLAFGPDDRLYIGCYEPSQVLRMQPGAGGVETVFEDPTAHLLCHPTNLAFRGNQLFTANLGRWHLTLIEDL